ncbi:Copper chaperone for superoxide dismutase-like [Frankliniella occidentalis]|uniref:Extracellular superoxide dismutase [Cu-Zn] n=2 Tax=Frankliniella occidentalis TaxID=133901 RepID=A0A6J1RZ67_FRAOC|nr:copper chaperone for superoxide dismutase isoform X1 [Frankliniella occidentalis]KAE8748469.1 Copper chaperone for superoxide dismutase-like [Frankliniella occidentalis]
MLGEKLSMGNNASVGGGAGNTDLLKKSNKLEFAVKMTCNSCVEQIRSSLNGIPGIHSVDVDLSTGSVVVDTVLPSHEIQHRIETTGKDAILRGVGSKEHKNLGAAVAMLGGESGFSAVGVHGIIRLTQIDETNCIIDGTIDGLSPGKHGLHVHECGDISNGCESVGDHFNPYGVNHGSPESDKTQRHAGDLGNVEAGVDGRAVFRIVDPILKVWDIIGRSIVVTDSEDDFGLGASEKSKVDGNSGHRLACGIIARSAGLFENSKKICACDGLTLWDEKNKPLAGNSRQNKPQQQEPTSSRL